MREVNVNVITERVKQLCIEANTDLNQEVLDILDRLGAMEESPVGKELFAEYRENAEIARQEKVALCQDTGLAVIWMDLGQDVTLVGGDLNEAIDEGVRQGYKEGYLRKSACHPFTRKNTGDNTPAILHLNMVPGDKIKLWVVPKGGGAENMSIVSMLTPGVGKKGVMDFVVERVRMAGSNPCPPTVVGVGIGGTFEKAALLAKKSLLRPLGAPHPDPEVAEMEREILDRVNNLGIGPQGLGGRITSLAVHIEMIPCHIASLPVAVNLNCHSHRHKETVI
ncbi:MAG: fumarate hydratase [Deltaproteobacteria bacterium]|nr:fumarate hydratase [Deltaproteobacteria bacterium]MBW2308040.1 fumarate hydratase [Deltaproteobacteria bacterium]